MIVRQSFRSLNESGKIKRQRYYKDDLCFKVKRNEEIQLFFVYIADRDYIIRDYIIADRC